MRKQYVVELRYSDQSERALPDRATYKSRDVALARVAAVFVTHPFADLLETEVESPDLMVSTTTFLMTVDRG